MRKTLINYQIENRDFAEWLAGELGKRSFASTLLSFETDELALRQAINETDIFLLIVNETLSGDIPALGLAAQSSKPVVVLMPPGATGTGIPDRWNAVTIVAPLDESFDVDNLIQTCNTLLQHNLPKTVEQQDKSRIDYAPKPVAPPAPQKPLERTTRSSQPDNQVHFTVYYPPEARPGARYGLYVYAHIEDTRKMIEQDILKFKDELGGQIPSPRTATQSAYLQPDTPITVTPECDEIDFNPPSLTKKWDGEWVRFDFDFKPRSSQVEGSLAGRISISVSGVEIAHIHFVINIVADIGQEEAAPDNPLAAAKLNSSTAEMYQKIFISYSRQDRVVAENYRLAQLAAGHDVFMDTYSIRTGQDWRAALAKAIDEADIFQLFWSEHSAASENVRDEWDYALKYRCPKDRCANFIRPVFWLKPMTAPPEELGHLNFRFVPLAMPDQAVQQQFQQLEDQRRQQQESVDRQATESALQRLRAEETRLKGLLDTSGSLSQQLTSRAIYGAIVLIVNILALMANATIGAVLAVIVVVGAGFWLYRDYIRRSQETQRYRQQLEQIQREIASYQRQLGDKR